MSIQFYIGVSGSGKSTRLYQEVIQWSMENPHTNYLIIVPDQFTMQTQKDMVMMHPNKGIMNIDVLSFNRLSHRIFEEVGTIDRPVLDDTGKSLILRKIAGDLEKDLKIIGKNIKKIGYIHEVKSAISEFMQYDIKKDDLDNMINFSEKRGALQYKLKDLKVVYQGFQDYIKEQFITTEETLDILRSRLKQSKLIQNSIVIFDGFTGFTPVQNKVIQELMVQSKEVIMTVTADPFDHPEETAQEQKLFHLTTKTMETLRNLAKDAGVLIKEPVLLSENPVMRFQKNPALAHLERQLFRYPMKGFIQEQKSLFISEISSPKEEIRQVAIKIKDLIRDEGYAYREIAVVCGELASYSTKVEEIFKTYAIPCYIDETQQIMLNPFIEYIRSALQISLTGFSYESMFHYLRSGLTDFTKHQIDQLENYVIALGIRGKSLWNKPFFRKTKEIDQAEQLEELNQMRILIMDSIAPLLLKEGTMKEYVSLLYAFIVDGKIQEKLVENEKIFLEKGEYKKAKEFSQIYRLVMELLEQIESLLREEKVTLKEFSDILDAGFAEIEVGTIPQKVDLVLVGDMERTRLKKIKILFFMGLNDGFIPKSSQKGGIISDIDREFLRNDQWEMAPSPRMQMYIQKLYLYLNMTKPEEQLYLSYSCVDGEGKSIRPAYLVESVQKLFPLIQIEKPQMQPMEKQIETMEDGLVFLIKGFREFVEGEMKESQKEQFFLALLDQYKKHESYHQLIEHIKEAAYFQYTAYPLAKKIAKELYGKILTNSVSRLETYASCEYAHFLQYGLTLKEREEYSFESTDLGNIYHQVLELFGSVLEEQGYNWLDFPKTEAEKWISNIVDAISTGYGETILHSNARNEYAISRMKRILVRTIDTLQYQLKKGLFMPSNLELSFSLLEDLDSIKISLSNDEFMYLKGRIDRVDTYLNDDKLYVKIIDYKSGKNEFDLTSLYYGLQLQLVVYMNAALQLNKKNYPDKKIIPAGIFYYQVDDPLVDMKGSNLSQSEVVVEIRKQLKMTGIVNESLEVISSIDDSFAEGSDVIPVKLNKDGSFAKTSKIFKEEYFSEISKFVNQTIKKIGQEILAGEIALNPYEQGGKTPCTYCEFKQVCGFDKKIKGFEKRQLETMDEEQVYKCILEKEF